MTRINIEIPEEIHRQLKIAAALKNETIKDLIIRLLNEEVEKRKETIEFSH